MNEVAIPVGGIGDWFKNQLKVVLLRYLAPFWNELKAAIQARDFGKIADIIERAGTVAGYVEIAKAVADIFRAVQSGDWLTVAKKVLALVEMILPYFQKATVNESEVIRLMATAPAGQPTATEWEICSLVDAMFPAPTVAATGDGKEPQKTEFGIIEIAAIASLVWTAIQFIQSRRKKKEPPVVG